MKLVFLVTVFIGSFAWASGIPVCTRHITVLRKGPGIKYAVSWKVPRYMPFMRIARKGSWDKVRDLEGQIHWARSRDLTTKWSCVVIKVPIATMRTKPSRSAPKAELESLDRYTPLKKIGRQGRWMHVMDEAHHKSWVYETLVWHPVRVLSFSF